MITREEKVERHFRNSVTNALIDLMKVMDPGGQRNWSYNYKDLLTAAKERIEAELLHGDRSLLEGGKMQNVKCIDCGAPINSSLETFVVGERKPLCKKCYELYSGKETSPRTLTEAQAQGALALPNLTSSS